MTRARSSSLLQKHIAIPNQHGSWALLLAPFAVGVGVSGQFNPGTFWLALASLGCFLALQPFTILIKVLAGRKRRANLAAARFWLLVYAGLALLGCLGMIWEGHTQVFWLALAALPVLGWYLWLVSRRAERGQMAAEIAGAGALALTAPAAFWIGGGDTLTGMVLWLLTWMQSAGAIVYIFLRLVYRRMQAEPPMPERLRLARATILTHVLMLTAVAALAAAGLTPWAALLPFVFILAEAVFGGIFSPGVGAKPVTIGVRQIVVTTIFALLLILAY